MLLQNLKCICISHWAQKETEPVPTILFTVNILLIILNRCYDTINTHKHDDTRDFYHPIKPFIFFTEKRINHEINSVFL